MNLPNNDKYDPLRGIKVIIYAKKHLDKITPLKKANWDQVIEIKFENKEIKFFLNTGLFTTLLNKEQVAQVLY